VCGFAFLFASCVIAQTAPEISVPTEPKALVLALATENGAPAEGAKPWHMKIRYTINNWDGSTDSQGMIEEFWLAPNRYKRIFVTTTFNQVEYSGINGIRRTGSREEAPSQLERILDEFLDPVPFDAASIQAANVEVQRVRSPHAKLACITAKRAGTPTETVVNMTYCSEENLPILRLTIVGTGWSSVIRYDIVKFQSRYFPKSIEQDVGLPGSMNGKPMFTAKLEMLESLDSVDEAQFAPPDGAYTAPKVIALDEAATKTQLDQHSAPVYPPIAKAAHVTGDVVLSLQIQTDGRVSRIRVLSGPAMLQQAAMDALKKWTYRPFAQDGEPVEVNTTAKLSFRL
jgi:TonB family protein